MPLGAIADEAVLAAVEVDRQRHAAVNVGRLAAAHQLLARVQRGQRRVALHRRADAEADLAQHGAAPHHHGKRLRADLGVEPALVAGGNGVERGHAIDDHAREHVEPAGGAFRIGGGGNLRRQAQAFQQRHDVDAARLQHRAVRQVDGVQRQLRQLQRHVRLRPRQEARAHAIGHLGQTQIEARRLDLPRRRRHRRTDVALRRSAPGSPAPAECRTVASGLRRAVASPASCPAFFACDFAMQPVLQRAVIPAKRGPRSSLV